MIIKYEDLADLFTAKTEEVWANMIYSYARRLGFDQTLFAALKNKNDNHNKAFLKSNYSPIWRNFYDAESLSYIDPAVSHCFKNTTPLVWSSELFLQPQQKKMYEEAKSFGLKAGIIFPLHGPNGEFSLITFVSEALDNPKDRLELLQLMPLLGVIRDYAFETSLRYLAAHDSRGTISLTPREKEILKWTMIGKSMWEISRILNCSESTVNFHITNVRHKFGVNSKHHAILKAIKMGLIDP